MKSNQELQTDVQSAINWEPTMHTAEIGVTVNDGVVTLSGSVDSYSKKIHAENAAKNVVGVKAIAEDIVIDYGNSIIKSDTEIANEILGAWKGNRNVPNDKIKVKVENGWVNLEGEVAWNYQKEASKNVINDLSGVKGVSNLITVKSESKDVLEKVAVEEALKRNWSINAQDIKVGVKNNNVKLTGLVTSIYQKEEAARLAWNAPGVWSVDNELAVIH
jgi:osmotically-inducible protein OsmY